MARAGTIPPLVELVEFGTECGKANAAFALSRLASNNADNVVAITRAGAIPPLVELAKFGTGRAKSNAKRALRALRASGVR